MIYVTGDTHSDHDSFKLTEEDFPLQKGMTKDDYLIICGDFGCVWGGRSDGFWLDWYEERPFTTLWIDGNHENFDLLNSGKYPVEMWNGGKVHKIRDHVFHLMRGQVFEIDGKSFFTMGGATSIDRLYRNEGTSWWPQEELQPGEAEEAMKNLAAWDYKVDYVITHTVPAGFKRDTLCRMMRLTPCESAMEDFLNLVQQGVEYKYWFNGHFHVDRDFSVDRQYCLFNRIVALDGLLTIVNDGTEIVY